MTRIFGTKTGKAKRNGGPESGGLGDRMRSYQAAAKITLEEIARDEPLSAEALRAVQAADLVVVEGCYDHVELVLDALKLPYTRIQEGQLARTALQPEQLLVINCPGQVGRRGVGRVREFVEAGGSLFSTDWALKHVIEPAFPGRLEFNERPTHDDVVRIEVLEHENPFLTGVLEDGDDPQWWLEASSYPIRVLDHEGVQVLIASRELGKRYGEAPVAVLFKHGKGEVFHMISHYFLQRTELRNARHRLGASAYAASKGVLLSKEEAALMADLTLGEVESAAGSTRFLANIVGRKKARSLER